MGAGVHNRDIAFDRDDRGDFLAFGGHDALFVHRSVLMARGAAEGLYDYMHMKEEMAALSAASPAVPAPQAGVETAPPPTPLEKWLGSRQALRRLWRV